MELSKRQEEGLRIAVARYKARQPWTCIAGYAGTGKSTLIKFIIAALKIKDEDVAYVSFTGKAASVLRHKGCVNAMTAHKLLYYSSKTPQGKFIFKPKPKLDYPYSLIVVDEISMLPIELWNLLLSHRIPIIACGDPEQLPPVNKNSDNHVLDNPHIFLDEIMRQAEESEIIQTSMTIREGKKLNYFQGKEVQVVPEEKVIDGMYHWADQILVATNKKRLEINEFMRAAAGRGPDPEVGDKVICNTNYWDILDTSGEQALVNGTIGKLTDIKEETLYIPLYDIPPIPILRCSLLTECGEVYEDLLIDKQCLKEGKPFLTPQQEYRIYKNEVFKELMPLNFNYGYAVTTHRAQGSEWAKVLVFEESFPFDREEHRRWLYTAVTRPSEKLVLVR